MLDADEIAFIFSPMPDILKYGKPNKEVEVAKEVKISKEDKITRISPKDTVGYHQIIADNYKKGVEVVAKLVPLYSLNTVKSYVNQCIKLEEFNGKCEIHSEPLKRAWLNRECKLAEFLQEPMKEEHECNTTNIETQNMSININEKNDSLLEDVTTDNKPSVEKLSTFGVFHTDSVCAVNDDLKYLQGFKDAISFYFDDNAKIVKIEEI